MVSLTNQSPANTYLDLLYMNNSNIGLDSVLRLVNSGSGASCPLALSINQIQLSGSIWPTSLGTSGYVLSTDGSGTLSWISPSVGNVTEVSISSSSLIITGSPITSSGTIDIELPTTVSLTYRASFTNSDLSSSILTVTHNIGKQYCQVTVINDSNKAINSSDVTYIDTNNLSVSLMGFDVTGTWNIVVVG